MVRPFRVSIRHAGVVVAVTTYSAQASAQAVDHAWAQFEVEYGPVHFFDTTYETQVEPAHASRSAERRHTAISPEPPSSAAFSRGVQCVENVSVLPFLREG